VEGVSSFPPRFFLSSFFPFLSIFNKISGCVERDNWRIDEQALQGSPPPFRLFPLSFFSFSFFSQRVSREGESTARPASSLSSSFLLPFFPFQLRGNVEEADADNRKGRAALIKTFSYHSFFSPFF